MTKVLLIILLVAGVTPVMAQGNKMRRTYDGPSAMVVLRDGLRDPIIINVNEIEQQLKDVNWDWLLAVRSFDDVQCAESSKNPVVRFYTAEKRINLSCE